jgi:hypothetical protein
MATVDCITRRSLALRRIAREVKRIRADENERKQGEKQTRIGTSKDKSQ